MTQYGSQFTTKLKSKADAYGLKDERFFYTHIIVHHVQSVHIVIELEARQWSLPCYSLLLHRINSMKLFCYSLHLQSVGCRKQSGELLHVGPTKGGVTLLVVDSGQPQMKLFQFTERNGTNKMLMFRCMMSQQLQLYILNHSTLWTSSLQFRVWPSSWSWSVYEGWVMPKKGSRMVEVYEGWLMPMKSKKIKGSVIHRTMWI